MAILSQNFENLFTFQDFEQKIMHLAEAMNINLNHWQLDHMALRANTEITASMYLNQLLKQGIILNQSIVNHRLIYLIQLKHPLYFLHHWVSIIELPMPKKPYPKEGWEHIEIVMPFKQNEAIEKWLQRILQQFSWQNNPLLDVKISQPFVEGEQKPNPTIAVSFKDKSLNHCCIKIHPYSIQSIIEVSK